MSDVFISYGHSTAAGQARAAAEALRALGYSVWIDDDLPAHRAFAKEIEHQLTAAKAALVIWSAESVTSDWVLSEANRAREAHKLVQLRIDRASLPMPFDQIQCADLSGWSGEGEHPAWGKVAASVRELVGPATVGPPVSAKGEGGPQTTAPAALKPSLAVLPFANLSGDPDQDYFADGMVEEIVIALSRFKSIFVIGSGSTLSFKGKAVSPLEAGSKLGVRYVLEGSVRKAGSRVRIVVKLTDTADGAQVWAQRFEDTLEDVFALQDRVALGVAGFIEPAVQLAEIRRAATRPTDSVGSYDLYLRALPLWQTFKAAEVYKALDLLERAVALDSDFAAALASAAGCHAIIIIFGWSSEPETHRRLGLDLARRAETVSGDDADVLARLALALPGLGELDAATALIDRAIALNPGSSIVWSTSGYVRLSLGEPDRAIEHLEMAMRLDPLSPTQPMWRARMAIARFQQGRFVEVLPIFREITQQTVFPVAPAYLASTLGHLGRPREAQAALLLYRERSPIPVREMAGFAPEQRKLFLEGIDLAEGASA
jgi:adenylate cyclase